jgi:hypothetical protein
VQLPISSCTKNATMINLRGATIVIFSTQQAYVQVHFPSLEHLTSSAHFRSSSPFLNVPRVATHSESFPLEFPTKSGASKYPLPVILARKNPGGFLILQVLDDEDQA